MCFECGTMRRRRVLQWILRGVLLAGFLLLLGLGVGWWFLPEILSSLAKHFARKEGVEVSELEIASISTDHLTIARAAAAWNGIEGRIEQLNVTFAWRELLEGRRIRTIEVDSIEGVVPWEKIAGLVGGEAEAEDTSASDTGMMNRPAVSDLPFDRIEVKSVALTVRASDWSETFEGDFSAEVQNEATLRVSTHWRHDGSDRIEWVGTWSDSEEKARISLGLHWREPLLLLDHFLPAWRNQLPAALKSPPEFREIAMKLEGELNAAAQFTGAGQLQVGEVAAVTADGEAAISALNLAFLVVANQPEVVDLAVGSLAASAGLAEVSTSSFALVAFSEDDGFSDWSVDLTGPVQWSIPDQSLGGTIESVSARIELPDGEGMPVAHGRLALSSLSWKDLVTQPWSVGFEASPTCLQAAVDALALTESEAAGVDAVRVEARQKAENGEWWVDGRGALRRNFVSFFHENWEQAPIEFALSGSVGLSKAEASPDAAMEPLIPGMESVDLRLDLSGSDAALLFRASGLGVSLDGGDWSLGARFKSEKGGLFDGGVEASLFSNQLEYHLPSEPSAVIRIPSLDVRLSLSGEALDRAWLEAARGDASLWLERLTASFSLGADAVEAPNAKALWPYFEGTADETGIVLSGYGGRIEVTLGGGPDETVTEESGGDETATARVIPIGQFSLDAKLEVATGALTTEGSLGFGFAGAPGNVVFDATVDDWQKPGRSVAGHLRLEPLSLDYVDIFGQIFPVLEGLSFTGTFAGSGEFAYDAAGPELSGQVDLTGAEVNLPSSQLDLRGIDARIVLESLRHWRTRPEASYLEIETVQAGDLAATDATVRFALSGLDTLALEELKLNFFDGEVQLMPTRIDLDEQTLHSEIRFERLSLRRIAEQISSFDGSMAGVISGSMPFAIERGEFRPAEGYLRLPPGESAFLSINAEGLLGPKEKLEPTFTDRILGWLGVVPEKIVEDALREIEVKTMEVSLFPADTPETPIHVQIGGEAHTAGTVVPVNLETRVHGTLTELYNFLIRMQALDKISF